MFASFCWSIVSCTKLITADHTAKLVFSLRYFRTSWHVVGCSKLQNDYNIHQLYLLFTLSGLYPSKVSGQD